MKRGSAQNYESISQGGKTQSGASETHAEEKEETEQNKTTKTHSLEGINVQGARWVDTLDNSSNANSLKAN